MHALLCAGLALYAAAAAAAAGPDLQLLPRQTPAPVPTPTTRAAAPVTALTGCHMHRSQLFCIGPDGREMRVVSDEGEEGHDHSHEHEHDHGSGDAAGGRRNCHYHAGVKHCTGDDDADAAPQCEGTKRDYNVGLRVGLLFAIMATSALGVFGPILLQRVLPRKLNRFFTILKQFGTGIIVSTAFVHLYTHAALMFANKCIGDLGYEAVTSAILMAGILLSFVVEYIGHRVVLAKTRSASARTAQEKAHARLSTEVVSILVMEAGILFHSLLIGLTLVVAGDSFFITLFVVILFHQVFEGLALGTRIATIGTHDAAPVAVCGAPPDAVPHNADKSAHGPSANVSGMSSAPDAAVTVASHDSHSEADAIPRAGLPMSKKLGLAALFAFVTPLGMAIGIGVLQRFNGNDRSTLIAIGTLDALSAGILVWVGLVEMWAADWMVGAHGHKADLADADGVTVALAGMGLVAGMGLMSLLGKWA